MCDLPLETSTDPFSLRVRRNPTHHHILIRVAVLAERYDEWTEGYPLPPIATHHSIGPDPLQVELLGDTTFVTVVIAPWCRLIRTT